MLYSVIRYYQIYQVMVFHNNHQCFLYYIHVLSSCYRLTNVLIEFRRSISCISRQKTLGVKITGSGGEDPRKTGLEAAKKASKQ